MSIYDLKKFSHKILYFPFLLSIMFGILALFLISEYSNVGDAFKLCRESCNFPAVNDTNLKVDLVYQGDFKFDSNDLSPVSSMAFLGPQDILFLNKNNGTVYRIVNNSLLDKPLLDVNVANERERGLLGIATSQGKNDTKYVYLYYTETKKSEGTDICSDDPKLWYSKAYHCKPENEPEGNRLYRYELHDNKLINPKELLDLPAWPSSSHNGGALEIGPDNNIYLTIGDLLGGTNGNTSTKAQNFNGTEPDGRAGILRVTQDGKAVEGILGKSMPLRLYYAYGIRNSFGIDFDPVTGNLWDTENGRDYGDEINFVKPGFNSGWERIQGIWEPTVNPLTGGGDRITGNELLIARDKLIDFGGKGTYSTPEFIWKFSVGVTAIEFLNSDKFGEKYENDLLVASFNLGTIFHFDLNKNRTGLNLNGPLSDKIADNKEELQDITFMQGLGGITDMDIGPDGYIYVLSVYNYKPTIFRISSGNT